MKYTIYTRGQDVQKKYDRVRTVRLGRLAPARPIILACVMATPSHKRVRKDSGQLKFGDIWCKKNKGNSKCRIWDSIL